MNNNEETLVLQYINEKQFSSEEQDLILSFLSRDESRRILNSVREFRSRIYTPLKTIHTTIKQVLSSDKSGSNAVCGINLERLLTEKSRACPNTGSYTKAKQRLEEETCYRLVKSISQHSLKKAQLDWCFHGREVKVFDGTTLTLSDTPANNAQYPKHSNKKKDIGYPQVRLLAVFSLTTGSVIDYASEATKGKGTGEVTLLRSILDCIKERDIGIGDALYCNYFLTHDLISRKADFIVPGHAQRCYDFNKGTILGKQDHIIEWEKPRRPQWMSKEVYKTYPKTIQIREFKHNKQVYVTTLTDASMYVRKELYHLYKRRWEIEVHLRSLKTHMGMDKLSSKNPDMVRKEIGIHLLAYNIIRDFMVDGCVKGNALPTQISFKGALQLFNQCNPHFITASKSKKRAIYLQMLKLITRNRVGKRPNRVEPRAVRKKIQAYPILRTDRRLEILKILTQRENWLCKNGTA